MAIGLSPWSNDLSKAPSCIQPDQPKYHDLLFCDFAQHEDHPLYESWQKIITENPVVLKQLVRRKRFKDLYNDCMIEVIKDDKTPPVCVAPADASYYCDGVPVVGSFFPNGGNDKVSWTSARFAHDICSDSDFWQAGCEFDRTDDGADSYGTPGQWCVHAPWDGGDHGYYGGPSHDDYHYDPDSYRDCDEALLAWYPEDNGPDSYRDWKPIYCRFWLMLDKYDAIEGEGKPAFANSSAGRPNPYDYFGEAGIL